MEAKVKIPRKKIKWVNKWLVMVFALIAPFFILQTQSQNIHEQDHGAEHYFENINLYTLIISTNLKERYVKESAIRNFVDKKFSDFYDEIDSIVKSDVNLSQHDFDSMYINLQTEVQVGASGIAPFEDTPGIIPLQINGPCENMDFETGNYNGWIASMGFRTDNSLYDFSGPVTTPPAAQCEVVTGGVDPNIPAIPRVFPGAGGGNYSIRLGQTDFNVDENRAIRLEQTFMVNNTNKFFLYHYALVFEAPTGHPEYARPYFIVDILDENNQPIQCAHYSVVVDINNQGDFEVINGNIFYKNWTTVFTNLEPYIGTNVTVRFQVGDCYWTGHQAYVYIEAACGFQDITAAPTTFCPGQTSTLTAPAGLGSYVWNTGESTQSIFVNQPGTYTVQLIPVQGPQCSATLQTTVSQYPQPVAAFTSDAPQCLGTDITFTSNSTVPLPSTIDNYQWDFGNGIVTPSSNGQINGVNNTSGTYNQPIHTYSASGTYNVQLTVTSSDGCTNSTTVPVTIWENPDLTFTTDDVNCFGGSDGIITTNTTGGTPNYSWTINGNAGGPNFGGLTAGVYNIQITDANGCVDNEQVTIVQPASLDLIVTATDDVNCFGGSDGIITTNTTGGTPNYSWTINGNAGGPNFGGLTAGVYNIQVTDANGCVDNEQVTIGQPAAALTIINGSVSNPICHDDNNGSIDVTVQGGTPQYQYSWSNGMNTEDITNLAAGTYQLVVTDANGCIISGEYTLVNPEPLDIQSDVKNITCYGLSNAYIGININGGVAPYTYLWGNGAQTQDLLNIGPGTYDLVVTDTNGCSLQQSFEIEGVDPIVIDVQEEYTIYVGDEVTLQAGVSGGVGGYTHLWSPPDGLDCIVCLEPVASPLVTTEYVLMVADANGCSNIATSTVNVLYTLFVPNTFSPNGDNINDTFFAVSNSCKEFRMMIFNRWGDKIFETDNINHGWDGYYLGKEAKQDVYNYRIEAKFYNGQYQELIGEINLIR